MADIRKLYEEENFEELESLSQRPHYNCFYDIDCGKDPYGIFSMIHTEGLHALEIGIIKYMTEILMKELSSKQQRKLDRLVRKLTTYPRQHGYNAFPRMLWSEGVSKLTKLTGDERVGKMFAIVLVALTVKGEAFFTKSLKGGSKTWKRMVYCFQQVLCYWAWLKQDHYWMADDEEACLAATESIKTMMRQLQNLWPRKEGLEWLLTKLHEQFHVPRDIHRNGKHTNVHSGPQEHNHIPIKNAAKKTQLQKHKIDLQTGERIVDRLILQRAFDRVNQTVRAMDEALLNENDDMVTGVIKNATKGTLIMQQDQTQMNNKRQKHPIMSGIEWHCARRNKQIQDDILDQPDVIAILIEKFFDDYGVVANDADGVSKCSLALRCFTKYKRNGIVYCCHPKYRGENAYYDWCYVKWWDGEDPITGEDIFTSLIGRIHLFIETPDGEIKAVVQSVLHDTAEDYGVFGTYWHLVEHGPMSNRRPKFELVDVDALEDHVMVVPYNECNKRYIHIHDRSEWPGYFQTIEPPQED